MIAILLNTRAVKLSCPSSQCQKRAMYCGQNCLLKKDLLKPTDRQSSICAVCRFHCLHSYLCHTRAFICSHDIPHCTLSKSFNLLIMIYFYFYCSLVLLFQYQSLHSPFSTALRSLFCTHLTPPQYQENFISPV